MKSKILIGLILILFCSICTVSAYDMNNITIPEDYHIANQTENFTLLESDQYHSISISIMDNDTDRELLKQMLEWSMYDFTYEDNFTKGSLDVEENYYNQEYQRGILYFCEDGDDLIVIDYKVPIIENLTDSPVDIILDGLD